MSKLKCKNSKGYKLTVGNEYEMISEEGDFVTIENDNGKSVRYSKDLFELVPEVVEIGEVTVTRQNNNGNLIVNIPIDGKERQWNIGIGYSGSNISCGIHQISGIDPLIASIINNTDYLSKEYEIELDDEFKLDIFRKCIQTALTRQTTRFVLMSTTLNSISRIDGIDTYLASIAEATLEGNNPNSNNDIALWVIRKS